MENTTNTQFHNKLGMAFYHLDPRWISQKDFDNVADLGVVNSYRIAMESTGTLAYACKRAKKSGAQIWLAAPIFYSKRESLEEYMEGIDKYVEFLKKNDYWDTVVGFQWDEPLLKRAHTNADFYAMTGAISKAYGKRIFPVFSMQELLGFKGNPEDPDGIRSVHTEDTEFITDVAFDVYGYDFRLPPSEPFVKYFRELTNKFGVELKSTIDVYTYYTKRMLEIVSNPEVRVWYFPCTYLAPLLGGKVADEDYCIAHIEGLKKMLLEQKNPGGLFCYGYKSWGNRDHLDWWLHPDNPERWERFIKVCQETCSELSEIDLK